MSNRFTIASFDNLDKNFSYSLVGAGKERSGFHGTTIQTVIPKPSRIVVSDKQAETYNSTDRQTDISDITDGQSSIEINLQCSSFSESANRSFSRDRKLNPGIVDNFINPVDRVGPPSVAVLVLDTHSVYMIPYTNKILEQSPYGLQQAITILLTLNLTIYHIA